MSARLSAATRLTRWVVLALVVAGAERLPWLMRCPIVRHVTGMARCVTWMCLIERLAPVAYRGRTMSTNDIRPVEGARACGCGNRRMATVGASS